MFSAPIVIAGGSGFVGLSLAHHLAQQGTKVIILSRRAPKNAGPWEHIAWDGRTLDDWHEALDGAAGLVNLAGRSVDCIKTAEHQDEIIRSRVESTRVLGQAMRRLRNPPPIWVQMSTAHIYGDPLRDICTEGSAFGYGFAPEVGRAWESALAESVLPSQRHVILRTSFVLGRDRGAGCGALSRLKGVARWGLGGAIASGQQGISWIHEQDLNRLIETALREPAMQGAYIASSPNPVCQREFMRALRRSLKVPFGLPASRWMVRFGAHYLLKSDPELAIHGRYVVSKRLADEGFVFRFTNIADALDDLSPCLSPRIAPNKRSN